MGQDNSLSEGPPARARTTKPQHSLVLSITVMRATEGRARSVYEVDSRVAEAGEREGCHGQRGTNIAHVLLGVRFSPEPVSSGEARVPHTQDRCRRRMGTFCDTCMSNSSPRTIGSPLLGCGIQNHPGDDLQATAAFTCPRPRRKP